MRRTRHGAPGVGDPLAGDEAVVEPAQQGRGCDAELAGGLGHVERFSFCGGADGALVAGDAPVVPEALDPTGGV